MGVQHLRNRGGDAGLILGVAVSDTSFRSAIAPGFSCDHQRNSKVFQVLVSQIPKTEESIRLSAKRAVLGHAELFEPSRNLYIAARPRADLPCSAQRFSDRRSEVNCPLTFEARLYLQVSRTWEHGKLRRFQATDGSANAGSTAEAPPNRPVF